MTTPKRLKSSFQKYIPKDLNDLQKKAMESVLIGNSVFITGGAGTGKSFVLRAIINALRLQGRKLLITASTGVAARNIGGKTIHSECGYINGLHAVYDLLNPGHNVRNLEVKDQDDSVIKAMEKTAIENKNKLIARLKTNNDYCEKWRTCDVLIVDEISMIDEITLEFFHSVLCRIRGSKHPFGGLQVVFCGDFLQLQPVKGDFAFGALTWHCLNMETFDLQEIVRQTDSVFKKNLSDVREGRISNDFINLLNRNVDEFIEECNGIVPFHLTSTVAETEALNLKYLRDMKSKIVRFYAIDTYTKDFSHSTFSAKLQCMVGKDVSICIGAPVMMLKNTEHYVNGSFGRVLKIDAVNKRVTVKLLDSKKTHILCPMDFEITSTSGEKLGIRNAFPFQVAFATTIHKCIGLTLEKIIVHCDNLFTEAQVYVALSRVRDIKDVCTIGLLPEHVKASERALGFYKDLIDN